MSTTWVRIGSCIFSDEQYMGENRVLQGWAVNGWKWWIPPTYMDFKYKSSILVLEHTLILGHTQNPVHALMRGYTLIMGGDAHSGSYAHSGAHTYSEAHAHSKAHVHFRAHTYSRAQAHLGAPADSPSSLIFWKTNNLTNALKVG